MKRVPAIKSILVYQAVEEDNPFVFANPIVHEIQDRWSQIPLFHIDSKSDSTLFYHAQKLLEDTPCLFIILNEDHPITPFGLSGLLKTATTRDQVFKLSLHTNMMVDKMKEIVVVSSVEQLLLHIDKLVSDQPS